MDTTLDIQGRVCSLYAWLYDQGGGVYSHWPFAIGVIASGTATSYGATLVQIKGVCSFIVQPFLNVDYFLCRFS